MMRFGIVDWLLEILEELDATT